MGAQNNALWNTLLYLLTYFVIFQLKVGDKQLICCEWNDSRICNEARGSYYTYGYNACMLIHGTCLKYCDVKPTTTLTPPETTSTATIPAALNI